MNVKYTPIYIFLLFLLGLSDQARAQKPTCVWYFGQNAGLDFATGAPQAIVNGAVATTEGTAAIADAQGRLLFYSDSRTVWNRQHQPMPNGTGLLGNSSTTQAALIVPQPGQAERYYVFTADAEGGPSGLRYSTVDMRLANGNGDLLAKNDTLLGCVSERLAAVPHATEQSLWLITHGWNSDAFYAFHVTSAGVNPVPVVSHVGRVHTGNTGNARGQLKASPDGTRLAVAIYDDGIFEFFRFNRATGQVSQPVATSANYSHCYGLEFSPDGTKAYGSTTSNAQLFQFDLTAAPDPTNGYPSTLIYSALEVGGQLQRGPDNRIYYARYNQAYLGVIEQPNASGLACSFTANGVPLGGQTCLLGLPNFATVWPGTITGTAPETPQAEPLHAYPNPTAGHTRLQYTLTTPGTVRIDLVDEAGRSVYQQSLSRSAGEHWLDLPLGEANIPAGHYILRLQTPTYSGFGRLIKQ